MGAAAYQRAKTHCSQGHPYSPENTRINKQGHRRCIECSRLRDRIRMKNPKRREDCDKRTRDWQARNKEKVSASVKDWRQRNKDRFNRVKNDWRHGNPLSPEQREAARLKAVEWRREHPEAYMLWARKNTHRIKAIHQRRRAVESKSAGSFTGEQWVARLEYHGNKCRYCGCSDKALTVDHMIPLSRGGSNWPSNLVPACKSCNSGKRHKTYFEFISWKEAQHERWSEFRTA